MMKMITDRSGKLSILLFGLLFCLLLLVFLVIEMGGAYQNYEYAESVLQRAANSAVESNMDDAYRADRVLILDAANAESDFRAFVASDFPSKYTVTVQAVTANASPPALTAAGTISFPTIFSQYGFRDLTFSFAVRATNYDLD